MARKTESVVETPAPEAPLTQRAYTLRLRGTDTQDDSWRDALWATHEAVNKGAKVFGEWLLTLRGGLSHELADQRVIEGKGASKKERDPTDDERRDRRILLALSWLSVESAPRDKDDPRKPFLIGAANGPTSREQALREALADILQKRGLSTPEIGDPNVEPENQPDTWLGQCGPSLAARIREDAVWVNRSAMFDAVTSGWQKQDARSDAHTLLSFILSDDFLTLPTAKKQQGKKNDKDPEASENESEQEERQKAVKASSRGAGQRTRHPFSHLLGEGKPFGKPQRTLSLRDQWHGYIKPKLEEVGIPVLDAKASNKGKRKDAAPAHTELQREMFSKAASRVAQIVTKQRQQEADRLARREADADLRMMENDAAYADALKALQEYCDEYRVMSGATGEFLIRPRAVTGWDRVVKRWAGITEANPDAAREARIEAVKEAQDADEEKKFGDANLFMRLADERYRPVWQINGNADRTILERFVKGMKARSDSKRLKVAAYRHPDPYFNPIFCQFGVSRPAIRFGRLKAFSDSPAANDLRAVGMLLWHPNKKCAQITVMHGVSRRLDREIGSACDQVQQDAGKLPSVSRRGRLGAAAAGLASADAPARVAGVFDLKKVKSRAKDDAKEEHEDEGSGNGKLKEPTWNGTLSTNRRDLAAIARLIANGDAQKAERRRQQLRWTLTVSMDMECRGPFIEYAARHGINANSKGEYYPNADRNKADRRKGHAKLILSRLPGLRVLSVDLGHRFAAACAVWDALPKADFEQEIKGREIIAGGTGPEHLFCHTQHKDAAGKQRTTIYRRIGCDNLPDDAKHPAPWARLDRQFFIKLQGEETPARKASPEETKLVERLERELGRRRDDGQRLPRRVDDLMAEAVRTLRLGLRRHGRVARIAYAFNPDCPGIPGMGGSLKAIERGSNDHIQFLVNALADWYALATDSVWNSSAARRLWNEHIKPVPNGFEIAQPTQPEPNAEPTTRQQRRKSEEALREKLRPIAEHFAGADKESTRGIHEAWKNLWEEQDGTGRSKGDFDHTLLRDQNGKVVGSRTRPKAGQETAGGWHEHLRRVTDWITGRRYPGEESPSNGWKQNVGGLSLTRIATMRSLYQLHKAFAMRPRPDKVQGAPERGESNAGTAQSILDAMERMREQRVKQLASRIVEAALGVGRMKQTDCRDRKRPRSPVDAPCHAIVIESLRNYRPDELQTRRENRALMNWSAGKVRKYLEEACQLHGLHLREVMPNYTSRQCSRTGLPGMRCDDVPIDEFLTAPWWNKAVNAAAKRLQENGTDSLDQMLVALREKWSKASDSDKRGQRTLRLPRAGGDLFVAAPPNGAATGQKPRRALQADLNAAANIGLRALLDPDFPGRWWYIPCIEDKAAGTAVPRADRVKGSACFGPDPSKPEQSGSLKPGAGHSSDEHSRPVRQQATSRSNADGQETTNFWSDPRATALRNAEDGSWLPTPAYWRWVRKRVVAALWKMNGLDA